MNKDNKDIIILAIESSCDDTSAAIFINNVKLSNIRASQEVHEKYGGVVPELASREHQKHIVPVVDAAIKEAGIDKQDISAVAFTRGPGLMGSLLVGVSFAKSFALALDIPLIEVNHMEAHILAHFIQEKNEKQAVPSFPFLCMTVSGGHTQIVRINSPLEMEVLGETIDDAAGEAFDKAAKIMGLPYPGGPLVDKFTKEGNPERFAFPKANMEGYNFSFSGLKTAILYFLKKETANNPNFIEENKADLCASIQGTIIDTLFDKLILASKETGIKDIAIAGGVSANSGLRNRLQEEGEKRGWKVFIPAFEYCTDNAGMIAIAGYFKYQEGLFSSQDVAPLARWKI